jgi:fatty acid desaturase
MKLLAHSSKDTIPVVAGILHAAALVAWFVYFPVIPWWANLPIALLYSISISWNINGVAHNFIHNPFFHSKTLNNLFSWMLSVTMGFSQQFYDLIHHRHHQGNSDRKDATGQTVDPLSIYKFSHDDEAESAWKYTFLGFFRDDPKETFRAIKARDPLSARLGVAEIASWTLLVIAGFIVNWRFMCWYLPFYYFGHSLSFLNGYFLHYGANPDVPIAWGVSSYHKLYNFFWFNNGYHAEHHFRPRHHWTKMHELHEQIREQQHAAGVRVIQPPHALGFMDPSLPKRGAKREASGATEAAS